MENCWIFLKILEEYIYFMQNNKELDFDGVYRWENIPMNTVSRINKYWDGFMINKDLYLDAVNWLNRKEVKEIQQVIFDVLDGKITSKFTWGLILNANWEFEVAENKLENIYNSDNVSVDIQFQSKENWKNHNGIWILTIKGKKYFAKAIKHWKRIIIPLETEKDLENDKKTSIPISAKSEYKWQEYLDDFTKYNKDVNIIKPILAFDMNKQHFIIYPYIEWLQLLSDLEIKNNKLYSRIYQKYISYIELIESKWKVLDVKNNTNIYFDPKTEKIYIFDSVYNETQNI